MVLVDFKVYVGRVVSHFFPCFILLRVPRFSIFDYNRLVYRPNKCRFETTEPKKTRQSGGFGYGISCVEMTGGGFSHLFRDDPRLEAGGKLRRRIP